MPSSNKSSALARRAKRCVAEPSRVSSIRSCSDSLSRKPGRITRSAESRSHALASDSFGFPQSQGIDAQTNLDMPGAAGEVASFKMRRPIAMMRLQQQFGIATRDCAREQRAGPLLLDAE